MYISIQVLSPSNLTVLTEVPAQYQERTSVWLPLEVYDLDLTRSSCRLNRIQQ